MWNDLKRGLLRAWVVIAVAWIGLAGWSEYQVPNWAGFDPDAFLACPVHDDVCYAAAKAAAPLMHRLSLRMSEVWFSLKQLSLPIILLPPFALLIGGYIIAWVLKGFRARA
jgi:hypothetical protein